jgi:exopolyphosphatase/guanosine-5'-triphosphate,3'-diphosphate pyrophosphatase
LSGQQDADLSQTLAAIDLGSNSFHMVVARVEQGQLVIIDRIRENVRLAAGLDKKNRLSKEAAERALGCLSRFGQRLEHIPSTNIRAVGTNTFRKAQNSHRFLERAEEALGHPIGIISGHEEARLVYLGVSHSIAHNEQRRLVMDIGGGSTEIIIGKHFKPLYMESLFVGCVSLTQKFFNKDKITAKAFDKAEMKVMRELRPYHSKYKKLGWKEAVGSSGTIRAASRVMLENGWTDGTITLSALEKIKNTLIKQGDPDKLVLPGLSERRAPVFPGGIAILIAVFKSLGIESMQVSTGAVREGLLFELLGRTKKHDVRDTTIEQLISRFGLDQEHLEQVRKTVLELYKQTKDKWRFQTGDEDLLDWAAALHEIGLSISHDQYHKHGAYILENMDLAGFTRQEQRQLALLVRNQRKSIDVESLEQLSKRQFLYAMRLVVLLRLAVLLHRSRSPEAIEDLQLKVNGTTLKLIFPEAWLETHPLTRADLKSDAKLLKKLSWSLEFQ